MSFITAHVLDAAAGVPAAGVEVELTAVDGQQLGAAVTDGGGRIAEIGPHTLPPGNYRVAFATASYFTDQGLEAFYPRVEVVFTVTAGERHYHIPLLLSPYAYTTYRGS